MRLALSLLIILFAGFSHPCVSEEIHGRFQFSGQYDVADNDSLDAYLDEQYRQDAVGDLRLTWEPRQGNWDVMVHYQLTANAGDDVRYNNKVAAYFADTPPYTWLDLSSDISEKDNLLIQHKIDRMAVGYSASNYVIRVGRQALTWGSGKMFQIMDLVGPFAPNTVDTEYKPGVDMVYGQWLFDDGSDLQFAGAPRPKVAGGSISRDASTLALHYRQSFGEIGTTWLLSRNYEYWTIGAGLSGPLKGATWNLEIVPVLDVDGKTKTSWLSNISLAMTLIKRNANMFLEYYRNGYGLGGNNLTYSSLPDYLLDQINRGQVFNLSKNYVSGGLTLEWTPLWNITSTLISNLDDNSFYVTIESEYSTSDNSSLLVGTQLPFGSRGTEYGGIPISEQTDFYHKPASTFYLQFKQYF